MQVEAAAVAVDVQHLAAGVQAGHKTALHGFRIEAVGFRTARRHLRCVKSECAVQRKLEAAEHIRNRVQRRVRQSPELGVQGDLRPA